MPSGKAVKWPSITCHLEPPSFDFRGTSSGRRNRDQPSVFCPRQPTLTAGQASSFSVESAAAPERGRCVSRSTSQTTSKRREADPGSIVLRRGIPTSTSARGSLPWDAEESRRKSAALRGQDGGAIGYTATGCLGGTGDERPVQKVCGCPCWP